LINIIKNNYWKETESKNNMGNLETYSKLEWKYHKDLKMGLLMNIIGKIG
jgi:hypothetical protein